jgi:hypothetical protein
MKHSILSVAVFSLVGMSSAHAWCLFSCKDEAPKEAPVPVVAVAPVVATPAPSVIEPEHPYALPAKKTQPAVVPEWFAKLPADTADMVFAAGAGRSVNEQMAYNKAQTQARAKLAELMAGEVRTSTKSYSNDTGDAMVESNEVTIHQYAETVTAGAQRVDSQRSFDGKYYTVYVLMRLPLGENNALRKDFDTKKLKRESELRGAKAHQELESKSDKRKTDADAEDQKLRRDLGLKPEVSEIKLLDVDNEDYKKRRDEALKKPNAVIGQTVVQ